jgi:hypothetical protein
MVELERMGAQIPHGAGLHVGGWAALERNAVIVDVVQQITIFA